MTLANLDKLGDIMPHRQAAGTGTVTSVTAGDTTITIAGTATDPTVAVNLANADTWTGAHVWDSEDAGTTTVPSLMTLQHRNNAAGAPAAGYGVGMLWKLDSASRNLRTAVEIDAVWSTATDAAEVSSLAVKTMLAGVSTETVRFGTGAVLPDSDFSTSLGRALIDSRATDSVYISHRDRTTTSNYGFLQTASGQTRVNCESGQTCGIYANNSPKIVANTTGIGFLGATGTPVGAQTVTGSRGGNAALASFLTALATFGLIVDSTSA
jgi:hypothetical protein